MHDKKKEVNDILNKYDPAIQKVYQQILTKEKCVNILGKVQMKSIIDEEIMQQVQNNDN